ncbi:hypothetical protein [Klebsiella variicola]|uniref:hypothetical protein n=1 Tax=Klebsiella variicola TaxID=244366 RepID=UPI0022E445F1|nr:hypothetical protein [Klebsiella variicola]
MARKSIIFTVEANNRDKGKQFKITEMPASKADSWAMQLAFAVLSAGITVPDNMLSALRTGLSPEPKEEDSEARALYESVMATGMAGLAKWGISSLAKIPYAQSKPLMDELLSCVSFIGGNGIETPLTADGQVEEVSTLLRLRIEAFKLHIAFVAATAS